MKKIVKNILLILLAILVLEVIVSIFKTNHKVEYKIVTSNKDEIFSIKEVYKDNNYYFNIELKEEKYTFNYENKFFKTKKVIEDIIYYKKDNLACIYPVLKKDNYFDIICLKENKLYSYNYVKEEIYPFVEILKDKGYKNISWEDNNKTIKLGNAYVYQENIIKDTYIYIWKYNGFYSINNKKVSKIELFNSDIYINSLGVKVSKYYVIPDYDSKYEYKKFYIINMENNKVKELSLKKKLTITNDYYNNGVVDDKLYLFDVDNLVQYKINPKKNKYEIVGNKKLGGIYYKNNKFETKNIYEFKENTLIFDNSFKIPEQIKEYDEIYKNNHNYYYKYKDDIILYNDLTKDKIYLFNLENISEITLIDDDLYFIKDDTLYFYNIYNGLKKIITYDELQFNKTNRYSVHKK